MKLRFLPFLLTGLLIFSACQSTWNNYTRIYLNNATTDSFQVFIAYPPSDTTDSFEIKPLNGDRLLSTYYLDDEPNERTSKNTTIWLYNYTDTSYTLLSNCDPVGDYNDLYHKYLQEDNLKIRALNPNLNDRILYLSIDTFLTQQMVQDTLLTDSVFGVR
jgi:hypothetical protein